MIAFLEEAQQHGAVSEVVVVVRLLHIGTLGLWRRQMSNTWRPQSVSQWCGQSEAKVTHETSWP